jgi:uncharacterized protein
MRVLVDADACPGKSYIEKAAKSYNVQVILYCDMNHVLNSDYSTVVYVESGFQNVDMVIANKAEKNDIVVTQDYGVAAMVLGRGAYAVSPRGYIYSNNNIDRLLLERHISQKVRKGGGKTTNPKKRTKEDDISLYESLIKLLSSDSEDVTRL